MAHEKRDKRAVFDVTHSGVPSHSVNSGPVREDTARERDLSAEVSDEIVRELMRSVAVGEPEHVELAASDEDPIRDIFLPGIRERTPESSKAPSKKKRASNQFLPRRRGRRSSSWTLVPFVAIALMVIVGLIVVSERGIRVKEKVLEDGQTAVGHLMNARDAVQRFDFAAASDGFALAYQEFGQASEDLGIFNTRLGQILAKLPGGGNIDAAQRMVQAGQLLAQAGGSMSDLVSALAESGAILDPANDGRASLAAVLLPMQEALTEATDSVRRARELLEGVNERDVPDEQRAEFHEFMERLPELEQLALRGASYVRFLESAVAVNGNRTYLLLFQNTSELRPTGGFPGSYGIAIFTDGRLLSFEADDVYNPDGQISELIVPPKALQHITPGWGLRDSTWFVDFPASARKAIELYEEGSGRRVDGVLAITPQIIEDLLRISGPVSMPEYDLVLSADDFLPKLQAQVEYGLDKLDNKPKKIIMELAPIILRKLYQAPSGEWLKVLSVFSEGLTHRDIMMYAADDRLQEFITTEGIGGSVYQGPEDYLMVNIANVAGGKADAVTDTILDLESSLEQDGVVHELIIRRRHDGGTSDYGFYNLKNPAYIRVLVPKGSRLQGISGNTHQGFRPVVSYVDAAYDADLDAIESSGVYDSIDDVTTYEESGKTEFGFWLLVRPGETREVRVKWKTPSRYAERDYELYIQRQPGLSVTDFTWEVSSDGLAHLKHSQPALVPSGTVWRLHDDLSTDLPISATFE